MLKYVYKRFAFTIDTANTSYTKKFDLDKTIEVVKRLQITSNRPDLLIARGSQRIEINREEIFPEDFESRALFNSVNVQADDRYYEIGDVAAGNGEVKILFKDTDNPAASFTPYVFVLLLACELRGGSK